MQAKSSYKISPNIFAIRAGEDPDIWRLLLNRPIHHRRLGNGIVFEIVSYNPVLVWVKFDQFTEVQNRYRFSAISFLNGDFDAFLPHRNLANPKSAVPSTKKEIPESKSQCLPRQITPLSVKCPYCSSHFPVEGINPHIHKAHPEVGQGKKPGAAPTLPTTRKKSLTDAVKKKPEVIPDRLLYICPYCPVYVAPKNMEKHINKQHPGQPTPTTPEIIMCKVKTTKKLKPGNKSKNKRLRVGGKVKLPTGMRVLNVRSRHGGILGRKSG